MACAELQKGTVMSDAPASQKSPIKECPINVLFLLFVFTAIQTDFLQCILAMGTEYLYLVSPKKIIILLSQNCMLLF